MYNIDTLAKMAGVSRRTVRYYIQRELLPPPEGQKRGSYYTDEHLTRIKEIQELSARGVPLIHMKNFLENEIPLRAAEEAEPYGSAPPSRWERVSLAEGVELHFHPRLLNDHDIKNIKKHIEDILKNRETDN